MGNSETSMRAVRVSPFIVTGRASSAGPPSSSLPNAPIGTASPLPLIPGSILNPSSIAELGLQLLAAEAFSKVPKMLLKRILPFYKQTKSLLSATTKESIFQSLKAGEIHEIELIKELKKQFLNELNKHSALVLIELTTMELQEYMGLPLENVAGLIIAFNFNETFAGLLLESELCFGGDYDCKFMVGFSKEPPSKEAGTFWCLDATISMGDGFSVCAFFDGLNFEGILAGLAIGEAASVGIGFGRVIELWKSKYPSNEIDEESLLKKRPRPSI